MSIKEEVTILEALISDKLPTAMHPIMKLAQHLRTASDPTLSGLAPSLSTRQLLRLAKRLQVRTVILLNPMSRVRKISNLYQTEIP